MSVYKSMIQEYQEKGIGPDDLKLFLNSFDFYAAYCRGFNVLTMEQCFYLWRDFRKKSLFLKFCSRCQSNYTYSEHQDAADCLRSCQYCKVIAKAKRKRLAKNGESHNEGMLSGQDTQQILENR